MTGEAKLSDWSINVTTLDRFSNATLGTSRIFELAARRPCWFFRNREILCSFFSHKYREANREIYPIKLINFQFAVMSEDPHQEMLDQINKAQMELKIRLEQVSKLRSEYIFSNLSSKILINRVNPNKNSISFTLQLIAQECNWNY